MNLNRQVKEEIEPIPNVHTDRPEELPILKSMGKIYINKLLIEWLFNLH